MPGGPKDILDELGGKPRLAVATHRLPDGDAIGSVLGLTRTLSSLGIHAVPVNVTGISSRYAFFPLPGEILLTGDPSWHAAFDRLVVVDCASWDMLDETVRLANGKIKVIAIDHHASNKGLGGIDWIDPAASSAGEMVARLAMEAGWRIPPEAAQGLWMAIVTDTGRFSYENSTVSALEAAAFCLRHGAEPAEMARRLYQSFPPAERKLQSRALSRLRCRAGGRIGELWLRERDFADLGLGIEAAHEIVNLARDVEGVEVAFLACEFTPKPGSRPVVKISLRTREPHDAILLAERFGGGGHRRAAGCTLRCGLARARKSIIEAAMELYFPRPGRGTESA